jgi:hypothetical protein
MIFTNIINAVKPHHAAAVGGKPTACILSEECR